MSTQFGLAVVGWIVIGILYALHQRSVKRMRNKPPKYINDLLSELPDGWGLASYEWTVEGFNADLSFGSRTFRISTEDGRISAGEVVNGMLCASALGRLHAQHAD